MRAEFVLACIFFAGPHQLHRFLNHFCDCNRLYDLIACITPSEAAADKTVVHENLLRLETRGLRRGFRCFIRRLCSDPDIETVGLEVYRRVHRLHRRMRKIGGLVNRLERLRGA